LPLTGAKGANIKGHCQIAKRALLESSPVGQICKDHTHLSACSFVRSRLLTAFDSTGISAALGLIWRVPIAYCVLPPWSPMMADKHRSGAQYR
jgi:hypothetical protein